MMITESYYIFNNIFLKAVHDSRKENIPKLHFKKSAIDLFIFLEVVCFEILV